MRLGIGLAVLGLCCAAATAGWAANSCVTCHASLPAAQQKIHGFAEWSRSAHAQSNVACDACHGGNPAQSAREAAHRGLLSSGRPESPLYFTRIPATCGGCHAAELAAFKTSTHYKELQRSGRGPNCVTCHGAMATRVLTPGQMAETCSLCHTQPTAADAALVTLNQAGALLRTWAAKSGASPQLAEARRRYTEATRQWHAFNMREVANEARAIVQMARKATANTTP
ncbi:MAG: hypothetical protein HY543_01595 [Deltaproteobacteria bacterium]|nr:hypothetical protein [Deltaproteobacteria bacterium]